MSKRGWITTILLLFFALSFTFFSVQSGDALMYLTLVRDHLLNWNWPTTDPYLYSVPQAELKISHEYLGYFFFYEAWNLLGFGGLTIFKMMLLACLFVLVLQAPEREKNSSPLWMGLWMLAVLAGSFRFIERTSLFSDLFLVGLAYWLVNERQITRSLVIRLTLLFLLWVQLHPAYPLGLLLIGAWIAWHLIFARHEFIWRRIPWLILPVAALMINPDGIEGALYPFRFAMNEAQILKHHNLEWFPSYHRAFRWTPEIIAYWTLLVATLLILWRQKAWFTLRGVLILISAMVGIQTVRFVTWASFAIILLLKPWASFRIKAGFLYVILVPILLFAGLKNFTLGYNSSSGPRKPRLGLDSNFFPEGSVKFLKENPIPGQLYNAHDFGSYLLWEGYHPIFHHGFVTDMVFFKTDVVGIFRGPDDFFAVAKKYGWTKLLVDKHGSYPYFFKILSPHPEWKIVAEDDASYLIYLLPAQGP